MSNLTDAEQERFDSRWITGERGCHVWTGPLDQDGYGTFFLRRLARRAHRVAWFMQNGPIPTGMVINHSCRTRACVNPQHLNVVTVRENALRDSGSVGYLNSQKTHCPRGHGYDGTYTVNGKVQRICRTCANAKRTRLHRKWRAADTVGA